jgi:hypothetical protein
MYVHLGALFSSFSLRWFLSVIELYRDDDEEKQIEQREREREKKLSNGRPTMALFEIEVK